MKILVLNSGSSSLKFQIFEMKNITVPASGIIEQIGEEQSHCRFKYSAAGSKETIIQKCHAVADHQAAIKTMATLLRDTEVMPDLNHLDGIGHRVVHGGENFHEPIRIDQSVIDGIKKIISLAPLHNPANLTGIELAMQQAPDVPQAAIFDTAFHQTIPKHGFLYALPYELYTNHRIRRYGFHGTSHYYVAKLAAEFMGKQLENINLITLHLGNGASATAIKNGRSVDTSMGLTPLEGLIMGTRCGDLDPAILFYLARETDMDIDDLDTLLNKNSGLKGICGYNDMRTITRRAAEGDKQALLALKMFCLRIKKYIGSYLAVLGGADGIVFTGGIGENAPQVREMACQGLEQLGIAVDSASNFNAGHGISAINTPESRIRILIIPTDEEFEIAVQTAQIIKPGFKPGSE